MVALGLDAGVGITRHQHAGSEVTARVAGEVERHGKLREIERPAREYPVAKRRLGNDDGLDVLLDAAGVLGGERALVDTEGERVRPPARHDVADDRDVVASDPFEDENREPAAPLVLEDERHHVLFDRDRLGHADDLVGVSPRVRVDEAPEVLAGHGLRSYPGRGQKCLGLTGPRRR